MSFVGGGVGAPGFGAAPEPLHTYPDVAAYLDADPNVEAYTPLLSGVATVSRDDKTLSFALLWGMAPSSYFARFPDSFVLTAGDSTSAPRYSCARASKPSTGASATSSARRTS